MIYICIDKSNNFRCGMTEEILERAEELKELIEDFKEFEKALAQFKESRDKALELEISIDRDHILHIPLVLQSKVVDYIKKFSNIERENLIKKFKNL